jgi:hypothetical protein
MMDKILLGFVLCFASFIILCCDDFGNKSEYSILQEIEYSQRNLMVSKIEFKEKNGYFIAGFKADNANKNVWVLLNPKYPPYYKQMPQDRFSLTSSELNEIRQKSIASITVIAVLETRIRQAEEGKKDHP